jgi:hypothetical protein
MKHESAEQVGQAIASNQPVFERILHAVGMPMAGAGLFGRMDLEWYVKAISAVYLTLMVVKLLLEFWQKIKPEKK